MLPQFTTGVFNQKAWPRAGDTDDCWVISDLMVVHAVAPWLRLPNVTKYRTAAGNPDLPGPTPGSVDQSARAIRALYPTLGEKIQVLKAVTFADFLPKLKAGHPASIGVLSGELPLDLQFGYAGPHRVAVFWTGNEIRLANPLARAHSRSRAIAEDVLHNAVRAHPLAKVNAVLMPTVEQAFRLHPLQPGGVDDPLPDIDNGADDSIGG
jgi:hypothetical protein